MGMSLQTTVFFMGIASLAVAVVFAIIAARYYHSHEIGAVMRDLRGTGPREAKRVDGVKPSRRGMRRRRGEDDDDTGIKNASFDSYGYNREVGSTGFEGDDLPTPVVSYGESRESAFVLTRSVVVISSEEVIT